jgi:protein gp37
MENSNIGWCHHTQNFWVGCDKIAPECAHCYINRVLARQGRKPWGQLYRTKTWTNPGTWERRAAKDNRYSRVFTCSLSDFFHSKADEWRADAWSIIRSTPHLIYLILTKRPELIESRLPDDWGHGYPNVWLGVSTGCRQTLNKMDSLRRIPVHPSAVRFVSAEPLLEDIAPHINLEGFGWVIAGGESGGGPEYRWDSTADWRKEFAAPGRRIMDLTWADHLRQRCHELGIPFFFKQTTAYRSGQGEEALGKKIQEFPAAPGRWAA